MVKKRNINSLLSKGMLNIYLKVAIETFSKLRFSGFKKLILILKGIMTFQSQRVQTFCCSKTSTLIKTKRNRKWKTPPIDLVTRTLCFSSYKNRKLKLKLCWVVARERKKSAFLYRLFCRKDIVFDLHLSSVYSVLGTLSEYTCFFISENITSYTFVACF